MKKLLLVLNYLAVLSLLLSYLAPFINPQLFWPIAFFGLIYPILLLLNLLFVLLWLLKRKIYIWISAFAILLGLTHINSIVQFRGEAEGGETENATAFKMLSYNVRLFDLYNWKDNQNKITRDKIFDFIKEQDADILLLQEFYVDDTRYFVTLDTLVELQDAINYHVEYTSSLRDENHWGIASFFKFPIVNKGKIEFEGSSNNICIYTDIKVRDDTIRVYNTHLASIHFDYKEYDLIQQVGNANKNETKGTRDSSGPLGNSGQIEEQLNDNGGIIKVTFQIIERLKIAFFKRADQANLIADHMQNCHYPYIIVGDFNDTPISYAYHQITRGLTDAFVSSGSGLGQSYLGAFPSFRIDFILYNDQLTSNRFRTITSNSLSDHYPISCNFEL